MEDARAAILSVNQAFYEAFEALDIDRMTAVWSCTPADVCIHPGWEINRSWEDIQYSWRAIFAGTGFMRFELADLQLDVRGDYAVLTCIQNIYSVAGSAAHHARVAATHLFIQTPAGWRLTLHHGSPIAHTVTAGAAPDDTLN